MSQSKLNISGMTCGGCVKAVETALKSLPGIESVVVELESGTAVIDHGGLSDEQLIAAVDEAGFDCEISN